MVSIHSRFCSHHILFVSVWLSNKLDECAGAAGHRRAHAHPLSHVGLSPPLSLTLSLTQQKLHSLGGWVARQASDRLGGVQGQQGIVGRTLGAAPPDALTGKYTTRQSAASVDPAQHQAHRGMMQSAGLRRLAADPGLHLSSQIAALQPETMCLCLEGRDGVPLTPPAQIEISVCLVPPDSGSEPPPCFIQAPYLRGST